MASKPGLIALVGYGGPGTRCALTSRGTIDLSGTFSPQLSFWHRYQLHYNQAADVYVSLNDGTDWDRLKRWYEVTQTEWTGTRSISQATEASRCSSSLK